MSTQHIGVFNGVNLDLLGSREAAHYGAFNLADLEEQLRAYAAQLKGWYQLSTLELTFHQTNVEADFLALIKASNYDGFLINPAAWTHALPALTDVLAEHSGKYVEVHISNVAAREDFRQRSYSAPHALGIVQGFGLHSYFVGLNALVLGLTGASK